MTTLVQSVYLLERPLNLTVVFALSLAAQWITYLLLAPLWEKNPSPKSRSHAAALLLLAVCTALIPLESGGFSLGRTLMAAALLTISASCADAAAAAAAATEEAAKNPPAPTAEELLTEIRDLLKNK